MNICFQHPEYEPGTIEGYGYTLSCLKTFERNGVDLGVHNFTTKEEVKKLEEYFRKYFSIGQTTLSMHVRRIKAIAGTGKDKKWIKSECFEEYEKPTERKGMVPNTMDDFRKIYQFQPALEARQFGKDFLSFSWFFVEAWKRRASAC